MLRSSILPCSLALLGCAGSPHIAATQAATPKLAAAAHELLGRWRCHGDVVGPEGPSPSEVTLENALAVGGAWLRTELAVTSGKYPYTFVAFRSFDANARRWTNVIVDNMGGHATSSSTDGITWDGTSTGPIGTMQIQDTETLTAPGKLVMRGRYALNGTDWNTGYELSCDK